MSRKFKHADYETTLNAPIRLGEALPAYHLARFVVDVVAQLDLGPIYAKYKEVGGIAIAPEVLLSLLFYGYATGKFSSRKIEKATYEDLGYRYVAGGLHPDHDPLAHFRKTFLQLRLENLTRAKAVLESRAQERYELEEAEYDAKMKEREAKAKKQGKKPRGKPPEAPKPGPNEKDQYNFTDPDSRMYEE
jgi:transposase